MQYLIICNNQSDFNRRVNTLVLDGATVVEGTLEMGLTSHQKSNGEQYLQSRYAVVVNLTDEQREDALRVMSGNIEPVCCDSGDQNSPRCDCEDLDDPVA